jgi:DNA (cytosine-5)-methyltransferase 1
MSYTVGSLFAGIGGFDLGFERAGFKTIWQVEINPYCQKVLAKNFPEAKRYGDIRECGRGNLVPVDVICGGFPCQDISNAGLRAGIDGERSGLWGEMHRIIGELRPRFALVENVAALLGRGFGRVLGDLAEIGYDAEWEVISAADVGAPHLRERVWILAYPMRRSGSTQPGEQQEEWSALINPGCAGDVAYPSSAGRREDAGSAHADEGQYARRPTPQMHESASDGEGSRARTVADAPCELFDRSGFIPPKKRRAEHSNGSSEVADSDSHDAQGKFAGSIDAQDRKEPRERQAGSCDAGSGRQWAVEPNVGRVANGIPARVDRLKGLGNAVVPQIPEIFAHRIRRELEAR